MSQRNMIFKVMIYDYNVDNLYVEIDLPFVPSVGMVLFECNFLLEKKAKDIGLDIKENEFEEYFIVKEVWIYPIKGETIIHLCHGIAERE